MTSYSRWKKGSNVEIHQGYFCIRGPDQMPLLQGEVRDDRREIHIGGDQAIVLEKMFGPLIFWSLRITADIKSGEWIIERQIGPEGTWCEWARVPGQLDTDFAPDFLEGPGEPEEGSLLTHLVSVAHLIVMLAAIVVFVIKF